ncbi:MAG: VWA domain-containing protein, partial [Calditrichota bacterium]
HRFKLVVLCDVSKSMDLYSKFMIQFMYAFQASFRRMETFVFSTGLHRISDVLQTDGLREALNALERIPGWSGGTRIGESLQEFNETYGARFIDDRTIVLILSDGWETGDMQPLSSSMEYLQKKAARIIWLNPLAGNPEYQPTVQGMAAAMPFIDVFAPAHSVDSLRQLVHHLARSGKRRFS